MKVDVVVDVGNTRIKWGRCIDRAIALTASLPPDNPQAWQKQIDDWQLRSPLNWALSSVHPPRSESLSEWLRQRGDRVSLLNHSHQLPLRVNLEYPDRVGIDRLLDAVAANSRSEPHRSKTGSNKPMVIIDAGSAVTVDLVDESGEFRGGAIYPGLRLMAQSLHEHTALLPVVEVSRADPELPGTSTLAAMAAGIHAAVVGGIQFLLKRYEAMFGELLVFLTGGDASLLQACLSPATKFWPEMTLEGIRLTAEAAPDS